MTQKLFEELALSDDFMFCKIMEYEPICEEFLEMLFAVTFWGYRGHFLFIKKMTGLSKEDINAFN